jgi:hypothetical protein
MMSCSQSTLFLVSSSQEVLLKLSVHSSKNTGDLSKRRLRFFIQPAPVFEIQQGLISTRSRSLQFPYESQRAL